MKAAELYERLEKDFINPALSDVWAKYMPSIDDFLCDNFKSRSMGLVCNNSDNINKVYTAVFPSNTVMQSILDRGETEVMLFVHHPSTWDIRKVPTIFQQMDRGLLGEFKERRISIFNLHHPLDNYGEYSTSVSLARALGVEPQKPFGLYCGALAGVFGKTDCADVQALSEKFTTAMGHRTSLYRYGTEKIRNQLIAVVAGGGNIIEMLQEIAAEGVNTLITGVALRSAFTEQPHAYAEQNGINILGGTHYSTEKPACQAMCGYFQKLGLPSEFIEGEPILEDL
jgi:putative NIF3 family GTP cyclohydrolase 1 type 2